MRKYLVTGVSSGVGRALTKKLVKEGSQVWGVARRKKLLEDLKIELNQKPNFIYSRMDISKDGGWRKLAGEMKLKKFVPDVVIFNAAINKDDFGNGIFDLVLTKKMFEVNLFGILTGMKYLINILHKNAILVAISSSSALKGSGVEGIGYPASKAALSVAFESLHQKYKGKYYFKTILFGPINTGMTPFKKNSFFLLSEKKAVNKIVEVVNSKKSIMYCPKMLFLFLRIIKLLPSETYYSILNKIEKVHIKNQKMV